MNPIKRRLKSIFLLSGSQANGLMVLLPLLFLLVVSEPAWRWWKIRHWKPDPRDSIKLDSLITAWRKQIPSDTLTNKATVPQFFAFDPNVATVSELVRLGFRERLASRIENYREKGGVFRSKAELLKIYGMDSLHYQRLAPYVTISEKFKKDGIVRHSPPFSKSPAKKHGNSFAGRAGQGRSRPEPFDLNLADTTQLEALPGIGEKLSRRIIKYRSSLGGFVVVGQLSEVFGLDSATLGKMMGAVFVAPDFLPDRIDLNTANERILDAHPYLNRQEARAIVAYRFQHGRFSSVSDLRKLPIFSDEKIRRLEPYLKIIE